MALERLRDKIVVFLPRTPLLENKKGKNDYKPRLGTGVKSQSFQIHQFSHKRTRSFERYQQPLRMSFKPKIVMQTKEFIETSSSQSIQDYQSKRALVRRPLHMNFRSFVSRDFCSNPSNYSALSSSPKPNRQANKEYIEGLFKQLKPVN